MFRITLKATAMAAWCKEHDTSRDELARRMGVHKTTAYRVESGQVAPSPAFIAGLMTVTGKSFDDLFEIVGEAAA